MDQKSKKPTSSESNLQNRKRQFHKPLHEGLELMHPSGQALHSKVSTIARLNSADRGNSVALTEVFKHNSIDNALQSVVGHKRKVHDLTPKENIGREDTHSRAKKIGKGRPDSPYANFTNSQVLTTSQL
ncbi:hypothetical protein OsI_28204 [Oryza sativa Indica Group]|uniref:Uncharacterized protein n=1 Tax=Oryza sativa subsp. indica TaxID=39946 RepID=A2YSA3_ORYSI|nr:hypothetical protein OsI_28204 [Oryza sativa Indica Group]